MGRKRYFTRLGVALLLLPFATAIISILSTIISYLVIVIGAFAAGNAYGDPMQNPTNIVLSTFIITLTNYGVMALVLWLGVNQMPEEPMDTEDITWAGFTQVAIFTYTVMIVTALVPVFIESYISEMLDIQYQGALSGMLSMPLWGQILFSGIMAPVFEELIFRKMLVRHLRWAGDAFAIFSSAAAFAFVHGNLEQCFYAFFVGVIFATVYIYTGNIGVTIGLHAVVNTASTLISNIPGEQGVVLGNAIQVAIMAAGIIIVAANKANASSVIQFLTTPNSESRDPSCDYYQQFDKDGLPLKIRPKDQTIFWYQSGVLIAAFVINALFCGAGTFLMFLAAKISASGILL